MSRRVPCIALTLASLAAAQEAPLPPQVLLGVRVETVRRALPVLDVVAIVEDEASYVEAIGSWTTTRRFPVLLDDGTWQSRERIAMFVRGFEPGWVVRWRCAEPGAVGDRAAAVDRAIGRAWEREDLAGVAELWRRAETLPLGVVVCNERDGAWTAGLALAAGHGQPIAWTHLRGNVDGAMSVEDALAISRVASERCEALGFEWAALGDEIDMVTICAGAAARVRAEQREVLATTDVVGRDGIGGTGRWAWCGQVFGSESEAAYRAMSALFLQPERAWGFDGYPATPPWDEYAIRAAEGTLAEMGIDLAAHGPPENGIRQWRVRAMRPIDAGLVLVNTKGNRDFFDLEPGRGLAGDVPFLARPAMAYVVHSWSAVQPGRRETIAGRWLERGVYAYVGSVQEPFLQAFIPPRILAQRLRAPAPLGAAVRNDDAPAWKIAVLGDPLVTIGPAVERVDAAAPLEGAIDLEEQLREEVESERFAAAVRTLTLLGRDGDAVRLASALRRERAGVWSAELAEAALMPAFREGARDLFLACYRSLDEPQADPARAAVDPVRRDALWRLFGPTLAATSDAGLADLMSRHVRDDQRVADALEALPAIESALGVEAGRAFVARIAGTITDPRELAAFENAVRGR